MPGAVRVRDFHQTRKRSRSDPSPGRRIFEISLTYAYKKSLNSPAIETGIKAAQSTGPEKIGCQRMS